MYEGERIRLRRVDPDRDAEDRYRWLSDPEVLRYLGMRPGQFSRAEVRQYLERSAAGSDDLVEFAVETREGHHIGGCTLREFNHAARSATYGIVIGEPGYRGKGYGTEVTRLILRIGFEYFNLNRIGLHVNAENLAGIRAYEKAGFVREGVLREAWYAEGRYTDDVVMAALRSDYQRAKGGE